MNGGPLDWLTHSLHEVVRAPLAGLGIDALEAPERLPWLLGVVGLGCFWALRRPKAAIAWPGMSEALRAGARRVELAPAFALALRLGMLACLSLVIARPVAIHESPPAPGRGLDLILVLDTSASMRALDTSADPGPGEVQISEDDTQTRLDLAKRIVARFATQRVAEGDRVGLVVFGSHAFTQCPLTSDGSLLASALRRVDVGIAGEATALGDALALAVKRAPKSDTGLGRVIVLLTDGRSNAGRVPVEVATQLAAGERLRVHTVGIGTEGVEVPVASRASRTGQALRFERHDTDPETLQRIADATGGRYFEATRSSDLQAIYRDIDALERVERSLPPRIKQTLYAEPLLAGAAALLLLEIALAGVLRRRVP
jgi:Ca-activated chloride channel family protein